jgi:hypothetical protein
MAPITRSNKLPPGYRSNIAYAIHDDDPQALLKSLKALRFIDRGVLLTEKGGKVRPGFPFPWSGKQKLMHIDNELYRQVSYVCSVSVYCI